MKRKVIYALLISLLASVSIVGLAAADSSHQTTSQNNGPILVGQILHMSSDGFTLEKLDGEQVEVLVGPTTRFRSRTDQSEVSFAELAAGIWVAVGGTTTTSGQIDALVVVLLPDDFDPENIRGRQVLGEIFQINNGQGTFTITTRANEEISFEVDDSTRFAKGIESLQDLQREMRVLVAAVEQEGGTYLARLVVKVERSPEEANQRAAGQLAEVSNSTLTLQLRDGTLQSFTISETTLFRSLDGSAQSLADLQSGHVLVVVYRESDAGDTAVAVIASGETLNQALHRLPRAAGEVQSAGGSHLTIQTQAGETLYFVVSDGTRIAGMGGEMELNELKNGMRVLVLYTVGDDDIFYARAILVGDGTHSNNASQGVGSTVE